MAGRSGDGVELNVFVLRRAVHDSIEAGRVPRTG